MPRRPEPGFRSPDRSGWCLARSRLALGYLLLGFGVALRSSLLKPVVAERIGFHDAASPKVGHPESVLGVLVTLVCGPAEPVHRLGFVLIDPFATGIQVTDLRLR